MGKTPGSRGVALGLAIAVTLGAAGGILMSRVSAEASQEPLTPLAVSLPPPEPAVVGPVPPPEPPEPRDPFPDRRACGARGGRLITFTVHVGGKQPGTEATFARAVHRILCDARGWIASERVRFRYDPGGDFTISLRSAAATERRCLNLIGLSVRHTWSCAGTREAVLNADRWFEASPSLSLSVVRYRRLLVNHEVGHLLGHRHRGCAGAGEKAPVMMQQSKGLGGCVANPWPLRSELDATG